MLICKTRIAANIHPSGLWDDVGRIDASLISTEVASMPAFFNDTFLLFVGDQSLEKQGDEGDIDAEGF